MPEFQVEPFTVDVPEKTIADMLQRLRRTRFPADFENEDWEYGFSTEYLRELVEYWTAEYDWREQERRMNEFSHFRTVIEGIPIHFIHERGVGPAPMPLLLHHGWPWTFWDLHKVIGPLTNPAAYGGDSADAFDVVVISLPGHGFSSPLDKPGYNFWRTADIEATLMRDVLGYERFATSGGDWGALIVDQLGHKYPDRLYGVHCHLPIQLSHYLPEHPDVPPGIAYSGGLPEPSEYSAEEAGWYEQNRRFFDKESGYGYIQLTKPQTIAVAMNDSPAGVFAWLIEKRRTWADTNGDIESRFTKDHLCTTATLYWVTETYGTSARFYKEVLHNPWKPEHDRFPVVEAPTACSVFTHDVLLMPHKWAEKYYNLKRWRVFESGGHFAPMEETEVYLDEVRSFFREFRCD